MRFDDLSLGGAGSFGLIGPVDTMVAKRLGDVVDVIQAAEESARSGSWVAGFVSYEAAPAFNPLLAVRPSGLHDPMRELPLAHFQSFRERVSLPDVDSLSFPAGAYNVSAWSPDSSRRDYRESLALTGRAIMSGEIARGKHTFRLHAAFSGDPAALYRDLLMSQRGPHAACVDIGRFRLVSASPERFFKRVGDTLTVSPVLASVRRGRWLDEDRQLAALLAAEGDLTDAERVVVKEIEAELAGIGELTPIPLEDRMTVDRLETLWHLTAKIGVRLNPGTGLLDTFRALFPPVSVTGVPKAEAMELIAVTEDTPRGAYCGSIGFLAPEGSEGPDASFSVAVRTVVVDQEEGVAEFGVGSPITNTSDVISAYEEARLKAKILVERRPEFRLVEQFRRESGVVRAVETKVDSLLASAEYFGFDVERKAVMGALRSLIGVPDPGRIVLSVDRLGGIDVKLSAAPPWAETPEDASVITGVVAGQQVSTDNVFLFHYTTDPRLRDTLTRMHAGFDTVVLTNEQDEVAGTLDGALAASIDGSWFVPPRECGNAPSAMRSRLIETGRVAERVVTRGQLGRAEQLAVIDDVHGWRMLELGS